MPEGIVAYLYGYEKPRFFAVIKKLGEGMPLSAISYAGITAMFYYRGPGEQEVSYYLMSVTDNINNAGHPRLISILRDAASWYSEVQARKASAEDTEFGFLADFSPDMSDIELFEDAKTGEYLLNFALGAQGFKDLDSALEFMHESLGIAKEIVYADHTSINRSA
jgi:hypothetical protein